MRAHRLTFAPNFKIMDPFVDTQLYIENYKTILEHSEDCYWLLTENEVDAIYSFSPRQIEAAEEYEIGSEGCFDGSYFYELAELQDRAEALRFQYDLYAPYQDKSQSEIWQERMYQENKLKIESIQKLLGMGPDCHYKNFLSFLNKSFKPYKRGLAPKALLPNGLYLEEELEKKIGFAVYKAQSIKHPNDKAPLEDLIMYILERTQEEAYKFEPERGFTFGTYLASFISYQLRMFVNKYNHIIHLPLNAIGSFSKVSKSINEFWNENQRNPSPEELAELLDVPIEKIADTMKIQYNYEDLETEISKEPNNILYDDNDDNEPLFFYETYKYEEIEQADASLAFESLNKEIDRALRQLHEREREILKMFFGIGCKEMDLEEIAPKFDLSRERVRQLKEKAIRRLKGQKSKLLRSYLAS